MLITVYYLVKTLLSIRVSKKQDNKIYKIAITTEKSPIKKNKKYINLNYFKVSEINKSINILKF